jgi:hypothetical protein
VELPDVERIGHDAFDGCSRLRRIVIPLKNNLFPLDAYDQRCTQFDTCVNLTTVDLVWGIHNTIIPSLLLKSWSNEMNQEIDRINQVLPNTPVDEKADTIRQWIRSVINRMDHYKAEHQTLLKENMTQLELAVWKVNLDEEEVYHLEGGRDRIDTGGRRNERRITSGADIIIRNVLPFLQLG